MARVAVVGVGAIGGVLAALLDAAEQHEITLCTRRPLEELTVKTPDGVMRVKATNLTDPKQAEPVDWVLVATKAYDAEGTAPWLARLTATGAPVAVAQNGVEHRERFAPWVKQELLLPIVVQISVDRLADGTMWQRGAARLTVEEGPLGREFAELFRGSKSEVIVTDDIKTALHRDSLSSRQQAVRGISDRTVGAGRAADGARMRSRRAGGRGASGRQRRAAGGRWDYARGRRPQQFYARRPVGRAAVGD
jgi:2-dehydropantoate 2-reductase